MSIFYDFNKQFSKRRMEKNEQMIKVDKILRIYKQLLHFNRIDY